MTHDSEDLTAVLLRAADGDQRAVADLLARHRDRLKRMVHLRPDREAPLDAASAGPVV